MKEKYLIKKLKKKHRRGVRLQKKRDEVSILVENLSEETKEEDLKKIFKNLKSTFFVPQRGDKSKHIGKAYVRFETEDDRNESMKMDGKKVLNSKIQIINPMKRKREEEEEPVDDEKIFLNKYKKKKENYEKRKAEKKRQLEEEEKAKKQTKKPSKVEKVEKKVSKKTEEKPTKKETIKEKSTKKTETKVEKSTKKAEKKVEKTVAEIKNEKYAAKQDRKQGISKDHMVYVHNLSLYTKKKELKDFFSKCGEIEKLNFPTQADQKSKGFAFITFKDKLGAQKAILKNGDSLKNRDLIIEEHQEKEK
eukprot:gene9685-1891_t